MPFENLPPKQREAAFATLLRGRRLAFEIGLGESYFASAAVSFRNARGEWQFAHESIYGLPATLVVLLASAGHIHYGPGGLWPAVGVHGPTAASVGQAFIKATRKLSLETFEDLVSEQRALRYLTPILAHGGIPRYCQFDFFRLLQRAVASGHSEAGDITNYWAGRPAATQNVDRPVLRFLLFGGAPALDFLQRCVDLVVETAARGAVPRSDDIGLPAQLVLAYQEFIEAGSGIRVSTAADVRPHVRLDPWDGLGPVLELPASGTSEWTVRQGHASTTYRGTLGFGHTVRLSPSRRWEVDLRGEARSERTFIFEGLTHGSDNEVGAGVDQVLFFETGSGRLWRDAVRLRLESVWALVGPDVEVTAIDATGETAPLRTREELPEPLGPWSQCKVASYDLTDVRYLLLKQGERERRVTIEPMAQRAQLLPGLDPAVVRSKDGAHVYAAIPELHLPELPDVTWDRWRVSARCAGETRTIGADTLTRTTAGAFELSELFGSWLLQDVDLTVRGPLGSDLRASLLVVPGLSVRGLDRVLAPSEIVTVEVHAAAGVHFGHFGPRALLEAAPEITTLTLPVRTKTASCSIVLAVPRLRWSLSTPTTPHLRVGMGIVKVALEELTTMSATSALLIDTGRAHTPVRLSLTDGRTALQATDWAHTSESGRMLLSLGTFADTLANVPRPRLSVVVEIAGRRIPVVEVVAHLAVRDVGATLVPGESGPVVQCRFRDDGAAREREVRFSSLHRPWELPRVFEVPDQAHGDVVFEISESLSPGPYLLEVALTDPWNVPARPKAGTPNAAKVALGERDEIEAHLSSIDAGTPHGALELAVARGRPLPAYTWDVAETVASDALVAACWKLSTGNDRVLTTPALHGLIELFASTPARLVWTVAHGLERGSVTSGDLLRLSMALHSLDMPRDVAGQADDPGVSDSRIRDVWSACPPLALPYELPRVSRGDEATLERFYTYLGYEPGVSLETGQSDGLIWVVPLEQLQHMRHALELRPAALLSLDAFVETNFEWLVADREGRLRSSDWVQAHRPPYHEVDSRTDAIQGHLSSRRPTPYFEPGQKLPRRSLRWALRLVGHTEHAREAFATLSKLVAHAPKMLTRDLVLASFLLQTLAPAPNDPPSEATHA